MDTNELHEELMRIGRQPVPPPRQEFVDELLARIKLGDDLPAPTPIQLVPRQPWIRFRMVAAGAVAAALLAAVGLFSLARENSGSPTPLNLKSADLTLAQPVSETSKNLKITEDGKVTGDPPPTGDIKATCQAEARIKVGDKVFACQANDVVKLTIADGLVKEAFNETTQSGPVAAPAAKSQPQLAAPATTGSTTTPSSPAATPPTSVSGTASEVPPKSTTTLPPGSSSLPAQLPSNGLGTAVPSTTFDLVKVANDAIVTVSWPPYSGTGPFRYVVLQTLSATNNQPDTPTFSTQADKSNAVATVPAGTTSYSVTLDGKTGNIPVNTHFVSFRVAVLDNSDTLLALSNTLTLELKWAPIKPAESTTTTTTTSTSTTTTTTTTTTASGTQATTK